MANTYLTRTFGSAGNRQSWTWSGWIKKSVIYNSTSSSDREVWFGGYTASSNTEWLEFGTQGDAFYFTTSGISSSGNRLMRDPNGWFHAVVTYDGSNLKFYYNNELDFNNTQLSGDRGINVAGVHTIGAVATNQSIRRFNGVMSHVHFVDGAILSPTVFGETDSTTGEWKIITNPTVPSYGTNGFFILKDGNSVTDQSGNSNNFTVSGGTLTKTEDCPSNCFATVNPLTNSNVTYANGNLTITTGNDVLSTLGVTSGKWYWEGKADAISGSSHWGIAGTTNSSNDGGQIYSGTGTNSSYIWFRNNDISVRNGTGISNANVTSSHPGSISVNDIIGTALDLDSATKNVTFYYNGSNVGNVTFDYDNSIPIFAFFRMNSGNTSSINFGNGYFGTTAVSSAGTNASNNGIFEYDVPTGYTALSTKGLNL